MTGYNGTQQKLTELFARKLNLEVPSIETDLVKTGLLDSLALVELLAQLEEIFGLSISADDLELDNFRSIASITQFITQQTGVCIAA